MIFITIFNKFWTMEWFCVPLFVCSASNKAICLCVIFHMFEQHFLWPRCLYGFKLNLSYQPMTGKFLPRGAKLGGDNCPKFCMECRFAWLLVLGDQQNWSPIMERAHHLSDMFLRVTCVDAEFFLS